jgi:hypothetical protein
VSGKELIAWAIQKCRENNLPPTDANILMYLREWTS